MSVASSRSEKSEKSETVFNIVVFTAKFGIAQRSLGSYVRHQQYMKAKFYGQGSKVIEGADHASVCLSGRASMRRLRRDALSNLARCAAASTIVGCHLGTDGTQR